MKRPEDDKEFMEVVGHLISHPRFQKLDGIVQHHHSTRLEHSVNVSYTSYKIAKKFGWDARVLLEAVSYMIFSIMIGE